MVDILALSILKNLAVVLFVFVCVALILIILLQKGKGGGLGAAFGGGGAGSLLGTKTGDFLTWVTISLVAGFLVLAVLMGIFLSPSNVEPRSPDGSDQQAPIGGESTAGNTATDPADGGAANVDGNEDEDTDTTETDNGESEETDAIPAAEETPDSATE